MQNLNNRHETVSLLICAKKSSTTFYFTWNNAVLRIRKTRCTCHLRCQDRPQDLPEGYFPFSSDSISGALQVVFDGTVWLPALVSKIVDVALREDKEEPYMVTEDMVVPVDGNSKFRWLILPLLFLQVIMRGMYPVRYCL